MKRKSKAGPATSTKGIPEWHTRVAPAGPPLPSKELDALRVARAMKHIADYIQDPLRKLTNEQTERGKSARVIVTLRNRQRQKRSRPAPTQNGKRSGGTPKGQPTQPVPRSAQRLERCRVLALGRHRREPHPLHRKGNACVPTRRDR